MHISYTKTIINYKILLFIRYICSLYITELIVLIKKEFFYKFDVLNIGKWNKFIFVRAIDLFFDLSFYLPIF